MPATTMPSASSETNRDFVGPRCGVGPSPRHADNPSAALWSGFRNGFGLKRWRSPSSIGASSKALDFGGCGEQDSHLRAATDEEAYEFARKIRAGTVSINNGAGMAMDVPFGGFKRSGTGRRYGRQGSE